MLCLTRISPCNVTQWYVYSQNKIHSVGFLFCDPSQIVNPNNPNRVLTYAGDIQSVGITYHHHGLATTNYLKSNPQAKISPTGVLFLIVAVA